MIEAKDVKNFKIFIRAICGCTQTCGEFPSSCRICLERNNVGILIRERWEQPKAIGECKT